MKLNLKKHSRAILGMITAGLVFSFVTLTGHISISSDDLNDENRRQKIEDMYNGYKEEFLEVKDVSVQEAMVLAADGAAILIDIREPGEQQVSMLPGAITEGEFMKNPAKYEDGVKIVYCTISYRSGKFAQKLQKNGTVVYNLRGGILAWVHGGGKIYDRNGETRRIHVYGQKWNLAPEIFEAVW
jgi:sodium/bile acid cotransporter 7